MNKKNSKDELINRIDKLEQKLKVLENKYRPHVVKYFSVELPFGQLKISDPSDFELPFDNVRAIFDDQTGNLIYIGLIDELSFLDANYFNGV
jgi:hypothetical protein